MEIIYIKALHYYFVMERTFRKLLEYKDDLASNGVNFYNDLMDVEQQICNIFDKIIDIQGIYDGKVLLYIALKQGIGNTNIISKTGIIRTISNIFLKETRTSHQAKENALEHLIEKGYIIDQVNNQTNRHDLKLNIEEYPELKTFIELICNWKIPIKYSKDKNVVFQPDTPKGERFSSRGV